MMAERINSFSEIGELPNFETKPKTEKTPVAKDQVDRIALDNNFPSRQAQAQKEKPQPATRKPFRHRTGRNQQINIKTTAEVIERLYKLADLHQVPLGELLEQALDALQKQETVQS